MKRTVVAMALVFPSNIDMCWGHAFQKVAKHLPASGK